MLEKIRIGDRRIVKLLGRKLFSYRRREKCLPIFPPPCVPVAVVPANNYADDTLKLLVARQILEIWKLRPPAGLPDAEFQVFSQWGEDGIIQWIIQRVPGAVKKFIEFGVENYQESNTRFLLMNNNWAGLVIDGSKANMDYVRASSLHWRHDLRAIDAFIDRDNIDFLIGEAGFSGEVGILSVDLDGVDYWVLQGIKSVNPQIVICEINGIFGGELPVSVPYRKDFHRLAMHPSGQYFGASLKAMEYLMESRGYVLIGVNSNAVNAFFVRNDLSGYFQAISAEKAWIPPAHSDTRDISGRLTHVRGIREKLRLIRDMPLVNVVSGGVATVAELYKI
jgi:hypothetical protein